MRSELRLADLKNRERSSARLMNVKIPAHVNEAIERVARELAATKTDVVIALLNQGLTVASDTLGDWEPTEK
jgi:hypothetical protein